MKYLFICLMALCTLSACQNDSTDSAESPTTTTEQSTTAPAPAPAPIQATPTPPPPVGDAPTKPDGSVPHFYCAAGCANGFGDQNGPCPGCGTTMQHNAAFHNQSNTANNNQASTQAPAISAPPQIMPQTNEPPQNAAGVWHYTCPNGCAGGSGTGVPCAGCGTTLVHNAAYHQ